MYHTEVLSTYVRDDIAIIVSRFVDRFSLTSLPPSLPHALPFVRSFVPKFVRLFVRPFVRSFVPKFVPKVRSQSSFPKFVPKVRSFQSSFVRSFVRPSFRSFQSSFQSSFVRSFQSSFVPKFVHSSIRPFVHSFVRSFSIRYPQLHFHVFHPTPQYNPNAIPICRYLTQFDGSFDLCIFRSFPLSFLSVCRQVVENSGCAYLNKKLPWLQNAALCAAAAAKHLTKKTFSELRIQIARRGAAELHGNHRHRRQQCGLVSV